MLDEAGFPDASICASNDLDEYLLHDLKAQGAAINSWGVGTHLITSKDCPSFGGVYKLSAIKNENGEFIPKIKILKTQKRSPIQEIRQSTVSMKKRPARSKLI